MSANIFTGPDAHLRFLLETVKSGKSKGQFDSEGQVIEGLSLRTDPDAKVKIDYTSDAGKFLSLKMASTNNTHARWQAMHIAMGPVDMSDVQVMGVVARTKAGKAVHTRFALRSLRGRQFIDHSFDKSMVSFAEESTHLDVVALSKYDDLPRKADNRELVLFFPGSPFELDIVDLRVFLV